MRGIITALVILLMTSMGCGSTTGGSAQKRGPAGRTETVDGLIRAEIDARGVLFVREDHGLGSYDKFLFPQASISYQRRSRRLSPELQEAFLASLEQSMIDVAEEFGIPIAKTPGECVLQVAMALTDVAIERTTSRSIGRMTLVMEFRDTLSGQPLLRYATRNTIENEGTGAPRSEQISHAFDDMIKEMDITRAFRAAGLTDGQIRPECLGTLATRSGAVMPPVSDR